MLFELRDYTNRKLEIELEKNKIRLYFFGHNFSLIQFILVQSNFFQFNSIHRSFVQFNPAQLNSV